MPAYCFYDDIRTPEYFQKYLIVGVQWLICKKATGPKGLPDTGSDLTLAAHIEKSLKESTRHGRCQRCMLYV